MDRRALIESVGAALWGFAEATVFFVVPDVLLTFLALDRTRRALSACIYVTAGALVGGALMYVWAAGDPAGAAATVDAVPAVSAGMIERVGHDLERRGLAGLLVGAFTGTPYKVFAVRAPDVGIGAVPFLVSSIPARLSRFLLVSLVAGWISARIGSRWRPERKAAVLAGLWLVFYAAYLSLLPW